MYAKLFQQMYDGTLATKGPWQALVTFQQLLVLADKDGVVDMTLEAVSRRTTIPLEVLQVGIAALSEPDEQSRTPTCDGKRVVPLSASRNWGWQIVNYRHYASIRTADERREYQRQYWHERKGKTQQTQQDSTNSTDSTKSTDTDTYTDISKPKTLSGKPDDTPPLDKEENPKAQAKQLIDFLNDKAGKAFRHTDANLEPIVARLREGYSLQDMKTVTVRKCREWATDETMVQYLRPATLYNRTKFNQYIGECVE